ncbi:MAG: amidohydrolase [Gemmataceae bacterium]|nr:amidohydrolase [Gemmataceae bacterium]
MNFLHALLFLLPCQEAPADLILTNGKIVTVDGSFSLAEAMAVKEGKILAVGKASEVLKSQGAKTRVIDLQGKMVLPGLIDSHVHPSGASMHDFDHPIPPFHSIQDVLDYIRARAKILPKGEWIVLRQVFITRLKEQRYPTRQEMDASAPNHPVLYSTGPDASLNSLGLKMSGIGKDFKVSDGGAGHAEKDPATGEPTGILRNCTRFVKTSQPSARKATEADQTERLLMLLRHYNAVGLTGIIDRGASSGSLERFKKIHGAGKLTLRTAASVTVGTGDPMEKLRQEIAKVASHPLRRQDPMLKIIGTKIFLDGGMLTGSAYMKQPWGVSKIYAIDDPAYRGLLFLSKEKLQGMVEAVVEAGLQFTAHTVGDGAVETLVGVYEEVNKKTPVRATRPCITHSNFMSQEAMEAMPRMGIVADIQPAWLYLDSHTLRAQFGDKRLQFFQPLQSIFKLGGIVGGGSDHMQKMDSFDSVNPYNPFLGMSVAISRVGKFSPAPVHLEQALTREQAIRFYTINNAHLMFLEKETGSLEKGKWADFIVLDRDILQCPLEQMAKTQCLSTWVGGTEVYASR